MLEVLSYQQLFKISKRMAFSEMRGAICTNKHTVVSFMLT